MKVTVKRQTIQIMSVGRLDSIRSLVKLFLNTSPTIALQIDPKYVKKIESVVRHGARDTPAPPVTSPCPQCGADLPIADLTCTHCEVDVPFCLASVSSPYLTATLRNI